MTKHMLPFRKMNGLGNDFAVIDARRSALSADAVLARGLADRRTGPGCDQVIVLEPSARANVFMRILNADGSEVDACGNATRCVAGLLAGETGRGEIAVETRAGLLFAAVSGDGTVTVDMGRPRFAWDEIPLSRPFEDTSAIDFTVAAGPAGPLGSPSVINVGNPHCIFWVDDPGAYPLGEVGPRVEHDPLFPERVNVSLARVTSADSLLLSVWERGTGLTKACGTAACAAAVAAARKGFTGRNVVVTLPGGNLGVEWRPADDHILMTGPWELNYEGVFELGQSAQTG
jgi:diaminopimelate epimerase